MKATKKSVAILAFIVLVLFTYPIFYQKTDNKQLANTEWIATGDKSILTFSNDKKNWAWYENDKKENYYGGTFKVYLGINGVERFEEQWLDHLLTPEEEKSLFDKVRTKDKFVFLKLTNTTFFENGKENLEEPLTLPYFGFLLDDKLELLNPATGSVYVFKKSATTVQE